MIKEIKKSNTFYTKRGNKEQEKINIDISEDILDIMLPYSLSISEYINKKSLLNLRRFNDLIDFKKYENINIDLYIKLKLLEFILHLRIDENIDSFTIIKQNCLSAFSEFEGITDYFNDLEDEKVSGEYFIEKQDVDFINSFVGDRILYSYIFKSKDKMKDLIEQIEESSNKNKTMDFKRLHSEFQYFIDEAFVETRNVNVNSEYLANKFELFDPVRRNFVIKKTIEEYNRPDNRIKTGIKWLNEMLNGGFEGGRFYLFTGIPKGFKSGTLLQIISWACKYNKNFTLKDPNKRPTIFYLTQENSVKETINRLYVHLTGGPIKNLTFEQAIEIIMNKLGFNGVNLIIEYRPNKAISTLDFEAMIDEINAGNNEVVLAIQDYTKRIRSSSYNPELRLELSNISNDFCNIAKSKNIPIISAAQMNRRAMESIEEWMEKGRMDAGKNINSSHIGESLALLENADLAIAINKEVQIVNGVEENYLSFKLLRSREESNKRDYFVQKFENGMKLEEDFDLEESLSIDKIGNISLADNFDKEKMEEMIKDRNSRKAIPSITTANFEKTKKVKGISGKYSPYGSSSPKKIKNNNEKEEVVVDIKTNTFTSSLSENDDDYDDVNF